MDELGIGIELDISGIGDLAWLAAADGCPDEEEPQAAVSSATAATPAAPRKTAPGRRPGEGDVNIAEPPQVPAPLPRAPQTASMTPVRDAAAAALIAHPPRKR
jgi:hypothetical protein